MKVLEFPSTAGFGKYRKFFSKNSVAHPAKMNLELLKWVLSTYTEEGEMVLDPMAGTGSTVVMASLLNRNGVGVELEPHFYKMMLNNKALVEGTPTLTPKGSMRMIQGDSRELSKILGEADAIITSPPYEKQIHSAGQTQEKVIEILRKKGYDESWIKAHYMSPYTNVKITEKQGYSGGVDTIISSPPYEGSLETSSRHTKGGIPERDKKLGQTGTYANIDVVLTSPPYFDSKSDWDVKSRAAIEGETVTYSDERGISTRRNIGNIHYYDEGEPLSKKYARVPRDNIGNLKGETYLAAMREVYVESWKVLKPEGKLILIVKNFIRNKKVVDLAGQTINLCEEVGFKLAEHLLFKLPTKSFWRILYAKKYPEVDVSDLDYEHVLVMEKLKRNFPKPELD